VVSLLSIRHLDLKMNSVTIPYHLAVPSLICIFFLILIRIKRKALFINNLRKWTWISLTVFLATYLFVVGTALYDDVYSQWAINRYDINKDGFFSEDEITPEQKEAMFRLTNDLGRNLSFFTGLVFGFILAVPTYLVGLTIEYIKSHKK